MHRLSGVDFEFLNYYYIDSNSFMLADNKVSTALIMRELTTIVNILEEYRVLFEVDEGYNIHIF
ncbi:hypothetical protein [Arcobacter sp. FWKO B]|uniref:hypothetical protein n=1 Tax=Arcobacter sp. FWKO B TaxID=2593672 RepID=UPI0018A3D324|nr:hypothetical protein [Arcobacter sp. FWKO B]QOG12710.1 hypothetical protein FWKOB_08370 [Arcobacter sp. FWKO B]